MADIFEGIQFRRDGVDPSQWPKLSCSAANQLALDFGSLILEGNREIAFQGNGQLRVNADLRLTVPGNVGINTIADPTAKLEVNGNLKLQQGVAVNEFSNDGNLTDNSDLTIPTEKAVKTYVDTIITQVKTALSMKAALNGVATQDFQTKNLSVAGNLEVTGTTTFRNIEQHQGDLELGNEDTDQVRIHGVVRSTHSSGTLQIGSSLNITGKLTVIDNANVNNTFLGDVGHGGSWAGFSHGSSVSTTGYALLQRNDGLYTLLNKKSGGGYLGFRVDNADKMIINDSGNVGIGINEPRTQLHVLRRISTGADFTSAGAITFYPPDGFAWFHIDNGPAGGRPIGRLRISIGAEPGVAEIISILQNMNVGIGTSNPQSKLDVSGTTKTQRLQLGDKWTLSGVGDAHGNDDWLRLFNQSGSGYFGGLAAEKLWSSTGTVQGSDLHLKREINGLTQALEKLLQLRGVSYYWQDASKGTTVQLGLIAQEVGAVFPELVEVGADGMKALNYIGLIPVLVEALKEQHHLITQLQDEIHTLATC